jgi:hypothetical protein
MGNWNFRLWVVSILVLAQGSRAEGGVRPQARLSIQSPQLFREVLPDG